ncbi:MAG: YqgE/AlgH family protein [Pirellulales bacterium]|nr:YqgE/AlgH family protein [Pirellulales bacterium]
MAFLTGHLLVASPHLLDPNFVKTVVFLVQHNKEGALGLVINRPIDKNVQDLWREVGGGPCQSSQPVFLGGPVPGPLMAVHADAQAGELEIMPGIFFSAAKPNLDALVAQTKHPYKIFIGNSGWGAGQLESELEEGAWLSLSAAAEYLFRESTELWRLVSRRIGRAVLDSMLKIKEIPDDPRVN